MAAAKALAATAPDDKNAVVLMGALAELHFA